MGKFAWKGPETDKGYTVSVESGTNSGNAVAASESAAPGESERFRELAHKLVKIPKSELDEKAKES
jgi:hypothetical protein